MTLVRESGQRLENVDQTHLVLASGKPVLENLLGLCPHERQPRDRVLSFLESTRSAPVGEEVNNYKPRPKLN